MGCNDLLVQTPVGWCVRRRGVLRLAVEKYRKYRWAGWLVGWDWRYRCGLCGRKGMTARGMCEHLIGFHGMDERTAVALRDAAPHGSRLDDRLVRVGGMRFWVGPGS